MTKYGNILTTIHANGFYRTIINELPFSTGFAKELLYNAVERGGDMLIDVTGVVLTPGNGGRDCLGNGEHPGIECCCDECDYMLCCFDAQYSNQYDTCKDRDCPRRK